MNGVPVNDALVNDALANDVPVTYDSPGSCPGPSVAFFENTDFAEKTDC
ncbi:MAG: hypothetical protein WBV41_06455 [Terriglobales bacterium]